MWTVKEKQADTGKHNAFKGAPVQISPSEAKHKASVVSAGLDSDFNLKKVQMTCAILDFQRSWWAGPHGRKGAGTKEICTSDNNSIPVKLSSRCQTMLGQISQTSWEPVCKGDVKENKCRRNFGRWCQICEAMRSCAEVQKPGSPGPPQSTGVNRTTNPDLLPLTDGIQATLQLVHILCSDLCQPETTKTTSLWVKPMKPPLHKEALF